MNLYPVGYKIDSGHFRLGSKIHIEDFYYAKRLFQNSYFATRFSFLLSQEIIKNGLIINQQNVTLIGYGLYSELMVNKTRAILSDYYPDIEINYNLINDTENLKFLNTNEVHKAIIIIVPIATTFSTSIKIEEFVKNHHKKKGFTFIQPFFNILVVGDGDFENKERIKRFKESQLSSSKEQKDILARFNWEDILPDRKEVIIKTHTNPKPEIRHQRYFICLPSVWHTVENCKLCFPKKQSEEKILIDTDPVSITPNLIFELPQQSEEDIALNRPVVLSKHALIYGHIGKPPACFIYKIKRAQFFYDNLKDISNWLKDLMNHTIFKKNYTLLLTPGHFRNSPFLDYVNETVFKNQAVIIHFKPDEDFIHNFITFHKPEIQLDTNVVYVDDVLASGKTFKSLNHFIRQVRSGQGVNAILTLIDRSDYFTKKEVIREIGNSNNFYAFKKLFVPPLHIQHIGCPLCLQYHKMNSLIECSMLDSMKLFIEEKREKLKPQTNEVHDVRQMNFDPFIDTISNSKTNLPQDIKEFKERRSLDLPDKDLFKLLITHEINFILTQEDWRKKFYNFRPGDDTKRFSSELLETLKTRESILLYFSKEKNYQLTELYHRALETALIKVLTGSPFIYFKSIREFSFEWIKSELIQVVTNGNKDLSFNFLSMRRLKLLLRRSVTLNSNFIISPEFLIFLNKLFDDGNDDTPSKLRALEQKLENFKHLQKELGDESGYFTQRIFNLEYKLKRVREFNYFIVSLVKELVQNNEAKSIQLERNLNINDFRTKYNKLKKDINKFQHDDFFYLWRLLNLENTGTLQQFLSFHHSQTNADSNYLKLFATSFSATKVINWLQEKYFSSPELNYKSEPLQQFLKASSESYFLHREAFLSTLALVDFLRHSKPDNSSANPLELKLEIIQSFIKQILGLKELDAHSVISIEYRTPQNPKSTNSIYTQTGQNFVSDLISPYGLIFEMLNGISLQMGGYPQTFIELHRTPTNIYKGIRERYFRSKNSALFQGHPKDELDISESLQQDIENGTVSPVHSHFLLYRLATLENDMDSPIIDRGQAVICISSDSPELYGPERIRLLLLAKEYLIDFLDIHFKNDSFVEMLENKNKLETMTTLQHGMKRYIDSLRERIENLSIEKPQLEQLKLLTLFLNNQLSNYTKFYSSEEFTAIEDINDVDVTQHLTQLQDLILEDPHIGNRISKAQISSSIITKGNLFKLPLFFLYQVFPELILNIKKANHHLLSTEKLYISWIISKDQIILSNSMDENSLRAWETKVINAEKTGGLEMINKLLQRIGLPFMETQFLEKRFIVTLHLIKP